MNLMGEAQGSGNTEQGARLGQRCSLEDGTEV